MYVRVFPAGLWSHRAEFLSHKVGFFFKLDALGRYPVSPRPSNLQQTVAVPAVALTGGQRWAFRAPIHHPVLPALLLLLISGPDGPCCLVLFTLGWLKSFVLECALFFVLMFFSSDCKTSKSLEFNFDANLSQ